MTWEKNVGKKTKIVDTYKRFIRIYLKLFKNFCILQFKANINISATNNSLHGTNAHFVRIHPINHTGPFACLRLALYGCDTGGMITLSLFTGGHNKVPYGETPPPRFNTLPLVY